MLAMGKHCRRIFVIINIHNIILSLIDYVKLCIHFPNAKSQYAHNSGVYSKLHHDLNSPCPSNSGQCTIACSAIIYAVTIYTK